MTYRDFAFFFFLLGQVLAWGALALERAAHRRTRRRIAELERLLPTGPVLALPAHSVTTIRVFADGQLYEGRTIEDASGRGGKWGAS